MEKNESLTPIRIFAEIEQGWHLYSAKTPKNAGPIPIHFEVQKNRSVKIKMPFVEKTKAIKKFDANFDSDIEFEDEELEFNEVLDILTRKFAEQREATGSPTSTSRSYKVTIPLLFKNRYDEMEKNNFEQYSRKIKKAVKKLGFKCKSEPEGMGKVNIRLTEEL
jgi:hypothetical protein